MGNQKTFSISEALKFGWEKAKKYWLFFLGTGLIIGVVSGISSWASTNQTKTGDGIYGLIQLLASLFNMILSLGQIKICLSIIDGQEPQFSDLFSQFSKFWKMLGGTILYTLIVVGGFILLIIPGIIWAFQFGYFSSFIVDKNLGPIESLKASKALTRGNTANLLLLGLTSLGIIILGALALLVGLVLALPTVYMASAWVYRKLESQMDQAVVPEVVSKG